MAWFKCAVRREITANLGGTITDNRGLILHHAVMNGSLFNFFNSPSAQVSATFWVSKTGVIEQYADSSRVTWHGKSLNSRYCGVETEGCTQGPDYAEPMTEAMIAALGRLYAEGMAVHGWRNALAQKDGDYGFGFHRMAVATACPCDVRLNMRPEILRRATGGASSSPEPKPPEPPKPTPEEMRSEDDDMTSLYINGVKHVWQKEENRTVHWWQSDTTPHKWDSEVMPKVG